MTPFLNNINRNTLTGRLFIAIGCSAIGLGVLMILIGVRTGDTSVIFYDYLPYLLIIHFPFWVLLVFAVNEILLKRFGKMAEKFAGRFVTMALLLTLTALLLLPGDESLIFSLMEILCGLLSLNLTGKSKTESYGRNPQ